MGLRQNPVRRNDPGENGKANQKRVGAYRISRFCALLPDHQGLGLFCREQGHQRIPAEFWAEYFAVAARDDFHAGRQGGGRGHERWMPDFEFLTQPKTMLKLFERVESEETA